MTMQPPENPPPDSAPQQPSPSRSRFYIRLALAAAAVMLLTAGMSMVLLDRSAAAPPVIAEAQVLPAAEANDPQAPPAQRAFAGGDAVVVRLTLRSPTCLTLLNVDAHGSILATMPFAGASDYTIIAPAGRLKLGPYRLDDAAGRQAFIVLASQRPIDNLAGRIAKLPTGADLGVIAAQVADWGPEVKVLVFDQSPRPQTQPESLP